MFVLIGVVSVNQPSILQLSSDLNQAQSQFYMQNQTLSLNASHNEIMAKQLWSTVDVLPFCSSKLVGPLHVTDPNCTKAQFLHNEAIQENATLKELKQHR